MAADYVSQETFVDVLQGLLLCFAAMSTTVETPLEPYARVCVVVLLPLHIWMRTRRRMVSRLKFEHAQTGERDRLIGEDGDDGDEEDTSNTAREVDDDHEQLHGDEAWESSRHRPTVWRDEEM